MERIGGEHASSPVPPELQAAIDAEVELKEALTRTGLPRRFQAMVLGLAAFQNVRPGPGNSGGTG